MLLPANALEQALHQAAIDEDKVESFYKLMMESRVFILGTPAGDISDPEFVLTEDDELMINHWESDEDKSPVIPFFTSLQTLQKVIPEDEPYLEVPTEALFRMTLGIPMVLNPNTDFGMEFSPEDVVSLLGSDTVNREDTLLDTPEYDDEGIYLDTLAKQPEMLVQAMTEVLKDYPTIKMAYLAVIHEPSEDPEPHLLVGLLGTGGLEEEVASIAERITQDKNDSPFEIFDFFTINDQDPDISNFLTEQVEPFYRSAAVKLH